MNKYFKIALDNVTRYLRCLKIFVATLHERIGNISEKSIKHMSTVPSKNDYLIIIIVENFAMHIYLFYFVLVLFWFLE